MVTQGLAWTSEKEPAEELESLKEQARTQGKGLWGEENPTPPWTFRRQQTMLDYLDRASRNYGTGLVKNGDARKRSKC